MVALNLLLAATAPLAAAQSLSDLYLDSAPSSPRPYIIPHYANSHAVTIGAQLYRFPVTGPASDYAFTLMSTNAPASGSLGVLPHIHQRHYENFFNFKGRFQLWAQKGDGEQEARLLTQGDYGSVPRNTTHTFQILDPDTEMVGVISPGGFEDLFYALGTNYSDATNTPYVPAASNGTSSPGADVISSLQKYDVYAQLDFEPTRDLVNGSSSTTSSWHAIDSSATPLGEPGQPYFIANNYGPKYLNSRHGNYQIVQPLVTNAQSQDTNFTLSTIVMSRQHSETVDTWKANGACAFEVLEGSVVIKIGAYPAARLETGDVAFVPKNTAYQYWTTGSYAKVLYVSAGQEGLDKRLIESGESWSYPTFPKSWKKTEL
ncbi:RmlC-like cupin domain-containing protein [Aspergillus foveolatus]|uniref:RmlC-like cupin domain-containing protein n=1 Tax=Aspergillus foveolatus TaxID=210207 RepID=UPI003CCE11B2